EVIKVEPPGGDPGRTFPPRVADTSGLEHGLFWRATNGSKRGFTLALGHARAPRVLADLVERVDFVLESFPPDGPEAALVAEAVAGHPRVIRTSITPFGDRPPGRGLRADDIVLCATGGPMYICGDDDRAPLRLPFWQAFFHAGAEAAVGTLLAHLARA